MEKVINPCIVGAFDAYARIKYKDGRLSIVGVIGPKSDGNSYGSCGQCTEEIRSGKPTKEWNRKMLDKFCDIWDEWHLNDMRPYCSHQKELGWREEAAEDIVTYHYRLTDKAAALKRQAEDAAVKALKDGTPFYPTMEQTLYAKLDYEVDLVGKEISSPYYEPKKPLYSGDSGYKTTKRKGWTRFEDSDLGLLGKPCPVCGYEYGSSWLKEDVPEEVISWLFNLPETQKEPAWI